MALSKPEGNTALNNQPAEYRSAGSFRVEMDRIPVARDLSEQLNISFVYSLGPLRRGTGLGLAANGSNPPVWFHIFIILR